MTTEEKVQYNLEIAKMREAQMRRRALRYAKDLQDLANQYVEALENGREPGINFMTVNDLFKACGALTEIETEVHNWESLARDLTK